MKAFQRCISNPGIEINARRIMRIFISILASLIFILVTASPVLACNITITPGSASGYVGDVLTFTIDVQKTHRNCTTPIDETDIKLKGVEMVSQTIWRQVSSVVQRKQISVKLKEAGEGLIEVIRECPQGGGYASVKVTIKAAQIPGQSTGLTATLPSPPYEEAAPLPAEVPLAETTWSEALQDTITQPQILALLILTVLAAAALIRRYRRFRYLVLLASLAYLGFVIGGCPCALSSLQNLIIRFGEFKYRLPTYLQVGIPVLAAIFFGRIFCGWVCPMGAVQYFIHREEIGKKAKSLDASPRLHNILRFGKYLALAILVIAVVVTRTTVFSGIDPFKALFNVDFSLLIPTLILIILLAASLFIGFPWCKYVCPLGAFIAIFSKYTLFKVTINDKCTNCKACHKVFCDYRAIQEGETKPTINQMECMRCGECLSRCPYKAMDFTILR